jgi:hypothetical protein
MSFQNLLVTTVGDDIECVLLVSPVLEIGKPGVQRIAIQVSGHHSFWTWADECFKDELVDGDLNLAAVTAKAHAQVSGRADSWWAGAHTDTDSLGSDVMYASIDSAVIR